MNSKFKNIVLNEGGLDSKQDLEVEKRFEQHIESIEEAQEMARNWKPKK